MERGEALGIFGVGIGLAALPRLASTAPCFPEGSNPGLLCGGNRPAALKLWLL
jgi:hypothetical protein